VTQPHIWYVHAEEVLFFFVGALGKEEKKNQIRKLYKIDLFFFFFFSFLFDILGFFVVVVVFV
jgi:hypothetical protein